MITSRFLQRALTIYCLAAGVLALIMVLANDAITIFYPYQKSATESIVAWGVYNLPSYPMLYRPFGDPPMVFPYTPLYAYLSYAMSLLTGPTFASGRIVALILYLICAFAIYRIWRLGRVSRAIAGIMTFFIFTVSLLNGHALYMQIDIPAMAWNFWGLYFALRWKKSDFRYRKHLFAAILFFSAAVFTKQTTVFGAGAFALYLLTQRNFKPMLIFSVALAGSIVALTMIWQIATNGNFLKHIYLIHTAGFSLKVFWLSWYHYPRPEGLWMFYAGGGLLVIRSVLRRRIEFAEIYFVVALLATILVAKRGSNHNYFIEITFASLLLIGMHFGTLSDLGRHRILGAIFWLVIATRLTWFDADKIARHNIQIANYKQGLVAAAAVSERVRAVQGKILSEDLSLLLANDKPVYYMPYENAQMAYLGIWDQSHFVQGIINQEYSFIITQTNLAKIRQNQRFSAEFVAAVRANYKPYGVLYGNVFYVPNFIPDRQ